MLRKNVLMMMVVVVVMMEVMINERTIGGTVTERACVWRRLEEWPGDRQPQGGKSLNREEYSLED